MVPHLERHVRAVGLRLDMARDFPARHAEATERVAAVERKVDAALCTVRARPGGHRTARDLQWLLAEYRVSVFAQSLGTARPVSPERIDKAVAAALAPSRPGAGH